jgi:hypothetical protein
MALYIVVALAVAIGSAGALYWRHYRGGLRDATSSVLLAHVYELRAIYVDGHDRIALIKATAIDLGVGKETQTASNRGAVYARRMTSLAIMREFAMADVPIDEVDAAAIAVCPEAEVAARVSSISSRTVGSWETLRSLRRRALHVGLWAKREMLMESVVCDIDFVHDAQRESKNNLDKVASLSEKIEDREIKEQLGAIADKARARGSQDVADSVAKVKGEFKREGVTVSDREVSRLVDLDSTSLRGSIRIIIDKQMIN